MNIKVLNEKKKIIRTKVIVVENEIQKKKKKYSELEISQSFLRLSRSSLLSLNIYFFLLAKRTGKKEKITTKRIAFPFLQKKEMKKKHTMRHFIYLHTSRCFQNRERKEKGKLRMKRNCMHCLMYTRIHFHSVTDWWDEAFPIVVFFFLFSSVLIISLRFFIVLIFKNKY